MTTDLIPYIINEPTPGQVIVQFAEICDHTLLSAHEKQLSDLVGAHSRIMFDLRKTLVMTANWLRLLATLTSKAHELNKVVVVLGMSKSLMESADVLALRLTPDVPDSPKESVAVPTLRTKIAEPLKKLDLRGAQLTFNAGPFRRECAGCGHEIGAYQGGVAIAPNTDTGWLDAKCIAAYGLKRRDLSVFLDLPKESHE